MLTLFLGVPLMLDKKIVGMLGVANREGGYSHEQQADLEAIAPAVMQALQRKKSEEYLREAYENLQLHAEKLRIQSEELRKITEIMDTVSQNSPDHYLPRMPVPTSLCKRFPLAFAREISRRDLGQDRRGVPL